MLKYAQNKKQTKNGNISVTYTGKGTAGKEKDDIAMCFQKGIKSMVDFFTLAMFSEHWS
jgi:hypothetical protein